MGSWERGLSYKFFVLSLLRAMSVVCVRCRLVVPPKVQFCVVEAEQTGASYCGSCENCTLTRARLLILSAPALLSRATTLKVQNFKQRQFMTQVSREMSRRRVKLNFCILTFWMHRRMVLLPSGLKVQNDTRLQVFLVMLLCHTAHWVGLNSI